MSASLVQDVQPESAHDHRLHQRRKGRFSPIESETTNEVAEIFEDKEAYRSFLRLQGSHAKSKLDVLQMMLSRIEPYSTVWKHGTVALQRLAVRTGLFPSTYELQGVRRLEEEAGPVSGGGYGEVYRGEYQGELVCVKMVKVNQQERKKIMKFYVREAILWGQLSHKNIVPFYGVCTIDFKPCLISPWAANGNVMEYLRKHPRADRLGLVQDVTEGLRELHARNIIHGDLKGANVLVDLHGCASLTDFGLSSIYDNRILDWTSQSAAVSTGGTVRWRSPELFQEESAHNTKKSDMYAWGCTVYEIFTGELPYAETTAPWLVYAQKMQGALPADASRRIQRWTDTGLDDDRWNLLMQCWNSQPENRPNIADAQAQIGARSSPVDRHSALPDTITTRAEFLYDGDREVESIGYTVGKGFFHGDDMIIEWTSDVALCSDPQLPEEKPLVQASAPVVINDDDEMIVLDRPAPANEALRQIPVQAQPIKILPISFSRKRHYQDLDNTDEVVIIEAPESHFDAP